MKLTVLVEDLITEGFKTEHGLAIHIQNGDDAYLLDTGKSGKFIENANKLGIDMARVNAVFISHNHYDHIGGLKAFFAVNNTAKVYLKKEARIRTYAKEPFGIIPIDGGTSVMKKYSDRFCFFEEDLTVDSIDLISDAVGEKHYFCQDDKLLRKIDGRFVPDDFSHELFVAIKSEGYVHVLSPCSHRGIVNILNTVKAKYGLPIGTVIAGLHMSKSAGKAMNCSEDYLSDVLGRLGELKPTRLLTGHCTGMYAYERLKAVLGETIDYAKTGDVFEI